MKVTTVKKARKPQGQCGHCHVEINAGDGYRWWSFRYGGVRRRCLQQACSPRRSELTQSEILGTAWDIADEEVSGSEFADSDDFQDFCTEVADRIRSELVELIEEKLDNIEQGMGHAEAPIYYELEERKDNFESWADEVDEVGYQDFELESEACGECNLANSDHPEEGDDDYEHEFEPGDSEFDIEAATEAIREALGNCPE